MDYMPKMRRIMKTKKNNKVSSSADFTMHIERNGGNISYSVRNNGLDCDYAEVQHLVMDGIVYLSESGNKVKIGSKKDVYEVGSYGVVKTMRISEFKQPDEVDQDDIDELAWNLGYHVYVLVAYKTIDGRRKRVGDYFVVLTRDYFAPDSDTVKEWDFRNESELEDEFLRMMFGFVDSSKKKDD